MRKGPVAKAPDHGTHARYVSRYFKCNCTECKMANTEYIREYRQRRRNNGNRPLKDDKRFVSEGIQRRTSRFTDSYIGDA